jgi:hypothetical protein
VGKELEEGSNRMNPDLEMMILQGDPDLPPPLLDPFEGDLLFGSGRV